MKIRTLVISIYTATARILECDETLEPTIYEIRDFKEMSISEGLRLIKEFYDHATLPVIDESWEKQYKNTTPPREYVLTCDNDIFYPQSI